MRAGVEDGMCHGVKCHVASRAASGHHWGMDAWYHCEAPYPDVDPGVLDATDSVRASLPNRYCDPRVASRLFHETLDEYLLCDELGLNITSSEHHAGINSLYGASPVVLGIVARQTKNIRLLSMGTLITVRNDPVRAAEE